MPELQLVDVSFRDGNQSLWGATGVRTRHVLPIAPLMDRVGFRALDFTSSTHMGIAVRTHREDPWERIRLTRAAMPSTRLQFISPGFRFISWELAHPEFMELVYARLVANGIDRFGVIDPTNDPDAALASCRQIREAGGAEIVAALTFTISDVHDDPFYARLAALYAASPDVDRVYLKDPGGLLTPERAATLLPALRAALGDTPLELHSHTTIGLSPLSYLTAAEHGVSALQTGCGPLAGGTSLPDAQRLVANLRELGHTVDVDDRLLGLVAAYFRKMARAEGLPTGGPSDFDAAFLRHQMAGGTMTTMRRQLAELGLAHRFDEMIEEVTRVRGDLGMPIMVTPFPQIVISQALANLVGDRRYDQVPDQVIRYVLGRFGRPARPVDDDVRDRILDRDRAREIAAEPPPLPPSELRRRFPASLSDDEFLLRATMPQGEVDGMVAAGPAQRHYDPDLAGVLALLRGLAGRPSIPDLTVTKPGFRLSLRSRA